MRKRFIRTMVLEVLLIFLFSMLASGCSKNKKSDTKVTNTEEANINKFSMKDIAVSDKESNKTISYGMTREDAEKILGNPIAEGSLETTARYAEGHINITYRDNKVVAISFSDTGRFKTSREIELTNNDEDIRKAYGTPTRETPYEIIYYFRKEGDKYITLSYNDISTVYSTSEDVFAVIFTGDELKKTISSINIGEQAAFYMRR